MPAVVNSSLTYEILMYLNSFYFGMFAIVQFGVSCFKAVKLPAQEQVDIRCSGPQSTALDFALLFLLIATESGRIYLGRKGNLTESGAPMLLGLLLTFPSAGATLYFLCLQHCTLRLELILCSIQLVLHATELVISVMCLVAIYRPPPAEE